MRKKRRLKINSQVLAQRIKEINYQYLKNTNLSGLSNTERVDLAVSVLSGILKSAPIDIISDNEFPSTFLGCSINWPYGDVVNDKKIEITFDSEVLDVDLTYQYERLTESQTYSAALAKAIEINGTDSVPDTGYTETNLTTTLSDSLVKITTINTSVIYR